MGIIFITYRKHKGYAQDDRWITVHPNGEEHKGRPVLLDDDGRVKNGMGGVWNGTKINESRSNFGKPGSPKRTVLQAIKQWLKQWRSQKKQKDQPLNVENGEFQQVKETLAKAGITLTEISGGSRYENTHYWADKNGEWHKEENVNKTYEYKVDKRCVVDAANQLSKLSKKFKVINEPLPLEFNIKLFDQESQFTIGWCNTPSARPESAESPQIELNTYMHTDRDIKIGLAKKDRYEGFKMPCTDENLRHYTVTHEFGHLVQYQMFIKRLIDRYSDEIGGLEAVRENIREHGWWTDIRRYIGKADNDIMEHLNRKERIKYDYSAEVFVATKDKQEIIDIAAKIYQERGGQGDYHHERDISKYGTSSPYEFFAECFANSQCGKPNILGEAMNRWLKEKGLVRK